MVLHRNADLLQIVLTLRASRRFAGCLDRRQQEGDQDPDDRDHNQYFDERKARACNASAHSKLLSMTKVAVRQVGWDCGGRRVGLINWHLKLKHRDGSTANRRKNNRAGHLLAPSRNISFRKRSQLPKCAPYARFCGAHRIFIIPWRWSRHLQRPHECENACHDAIKSENRSRRRRSLHSILERRFSNGLAWPSLLLLTFVVYLPALNGSLLWDDDAHITRPELQSIAACIAFGSSWSDAAVLSAVAQRVLDRAQAVGRCGAGLSPGECAVAHVVGRAGVLRSLQKLKIPAHCWPRPSLPCIRSWSSRWPGSASRRIRFRRCFI